jgi:pimeloyl-ACP methyl ester carboxylesterase
MKATNPLKDLAKHLRPTDLRGVAQLATQATKGVATMAEGVHQSVWGTVGVGGAKSATSKAPQTGGLTGLIYKSVRGITGLVGKGLDASLAKLEPLFALADAAAPASYEREAVLAALNGVLGDTLAATNNPLATRMSLRCQGQVLSEAPAKAGKAGKAATPPALGQGYSALQNASNKIVVLIHGLCMNDLQWAVPHDGAVFDHGALLSQALGYTPVYVRYNTGLHTSQNGHAFSQQLDDLVSNWPVPVDEVTVLCHSMGGLVTRSAVFSAQQSGAAWFNKLKNIVFLGTPHHGAPLERAGNWVDILLGSTPYSRPFAKLGQIRSSGITDLRYGHVLDADWVGQDRFRRKPDSRTPVPLPTGVASYAVAATTAAKRGSLADRLLGDGLVPLASGLGQHEEAGRGLVFAKVNQLIAYRTNHMQLLGSEEVARQVLAWLGK